MVFGINRVASHGELHHVLVIKRRLEVLKQRSIQDVLADRKGKEKEREKGMKKKKKINGRIQTGRTPFNGMKNRGEHIDVV